MRKWTIFFGLAAACATPVRGGSGYLSMFVPGWEGENIEVFVTGRIPEGETKYDLSWAPGNVRINPGWMNLTMGGFDAMPACWVVQSNTEKQAALPYPLNFETPRALRLGYLTLSDVAVGWYPMRRVGFGESSVAEVEMLPPDTFPPWAHKPLPVSGFLTQITPTDQSIISYRCCVWYEGEESCLPEGAKLDDEVEDTGELRP